MLINCFMPYVSEPIREIMQDCLDSYLLPKNRGVFRHYCNKLTVQLFGRQLKTSLCILKIKIPSDKSDKQVQDCKWRAA